MPKTKKDSDASEILAKLNKVSAEAEVLRELFTEKDERLTKTMSELGELKTLVVKADRDKEKLFVDAQARVERLETMLEEMRTNYIDLSAKIEKLGNFETISKVYKDVDTGLATIKEKEHDINLIAGKLEAGLKEFDKAKSLVERTENLTNKMFKNLDDIDKKKSTLATREELDDVKKLIKKTIKGVSKALNDMRTKATEETEGMGDLRAEVSKLVSKEVQGVAKLVNKMQGNIGSEQAKLVEEIDLIKDILGNFNSQINQNTVDPQNFEEEIKGISKALEDMRSKAAEETYGLGNFRSEILKEVSNDISGIADVINTLEKGVSSEQGKIVQEIDEIKDVLSNLNSQINQNTVDPQNFEEEIEGISKALEDMRSKAAEETKGMEDLRTEVSMLVSKEVSSIADVINTLEGKINSGQDKTVVEIDTIKETLDNLNSHINQNTVEPQKFEEEIERVSKSLEDMRSKATEETYGLGNFRSEILSEVSKEVHGIADVVNITEGRISSEQDKLAEEIDTIKETLGDLSSWINQSTVDLQVEKELEGADNSLDDVRSKVFEDSQKLEDLREKVSAEISGISVVVKGVEGKLDSLHEKMAEEVDRIKNALANLNIRMDQIPTDPQNFEEEIGGVSKALDDMRSKATEETKGRDNFRSEVSKEISRIADVVKDVEVKISSERGRIVEEIDSIKENLVHLSSQIDQNQMEGRIDSLHEKMAEEVDRIKNALANLNIRMDQIPTDPQNFEEEIEGINKALDDMRSKAAEETKGMEDLRTEVSGFKEIINTLEGRINSGQDKTVGEVDVIKENLVHLSSQIDQNTMDPQKFKVELERVGRALKDIHSQATKESGEVVSFKSEVSKQILGIAKVIKNVEGRITSLQNNMIGEVNSIKESLDGMALRMDQDVVDPQRIRDEQDELKKDLEDYKADLERKLSDISTVSETLVRKVRDSVKRLNEVSAFVTNLEKELEEFERTKPLMKKTEELACEVRESAAYIESKAETLASREELENAMEEIKKISSEFLYLQSPKAAEEIEAIKLALGNLSFQVDQNTSQSLKEVQDDLKQDLEAYKADLEGKLSDLSKRMNALKLKIKHLELLL